MTGLYKLREELHNQILHLRSIEGRILGLRFERLWEESTDEQKNEVIKLIKCGDKKEVNKWIREHPSLYIGEQPIREIRRVAQKLGIKNYSRLTKLELMATIQKKEEEHEFQQEHVDSSTSDRS